MKERISSILLYLMDGFFLFVFDFNYGLIWDATLLSIDSLCIQRKGVYLYDYCFDTQNPWVIMLVGCHISGGGYFFVKVSTVFLLPL